MTDTPHWLVAFQLKLMAALDAAWAILDGSDDPAELRRARDKAKACGELAATARKVAMIIPAARKPPAQQAMADVAAVQSVASLEAALGETLATAAPKPSQADHARRAMTLKSAGRSRL